MATGRQSTTPGLPDDEDEMNAASAANHSLLGDLDAIFADGKTYLETEIAYQKSRAGYAGNRLKWSVIYGAAAFGLLHLALIALTVGAVIALSPITGPWIATVIVVGLLIVGAIVLLLRLRGKIDDIRGVFETGDA